MGKAERSLVIFSKLQAPQIRTKILRRSRLVKLLSENLEKKLIFICAGAGYGKTTLLSQFIAEKNIPNVYYHLEKSDAEPAEFLSYLIAGLRMFKPKFGKKLERLRKFFNYPQQYLTIIAGTFINEIIENVKGDFHVILEDYHSLGKSTQIDNFIEYFLEHLPSNLHLIITSRNAPSFSLARPRAKDEVFGLTNNHLRFTQHEIRRFLKELYSVSLKLSDIKTIEEHSEGWPTSLRLMMQSSDYFEGIKSAGYVRKILDGFYQTQTNLFNYFAQEIYNKEPKEIRDFLLDCAVLEWLAPELCIAVTKHQNAGKMLSTIAKRNSFLIKMSDQSYRFHNLFRDFLRSKADNVGRERRILQRAAVFYKRQGRCEEAIKCYLQASNYLRASVLISKTGFSLIEQGKSAVLCSYIEQIPVQQRRMRPGLHTLYAQALINTGRSDDASKGLHAACRIFKEKRSRHIQYAKALYELGGLRLNAGKFSTAKSWFKRALAVCPKSPNITRAAILNSLGFVYTSIGGRNLNQATEFFNRALRIAQQKQYKELEASIYNNWAMNEMKAGNLNKAYSKLSRMVSFLGSHFSPHCGSGFFNAARLSLLLGYKDEAKAILDAGVKACIPYNDMWSMASLWKGYAFYYQDLKEWDKARRYISKALEIYEKLGIVRLLITALNEVCKINIATDELSEAEKNIAAIWWFKKSKDDAEALPLLLTHAKLKHKQNRLEEAEDMLTAALSTARRFKQIFNQFLIYIELSKVLYTTGQTEKLVSALQKAVQLSRDKGYDYAMLNELKGQRWMLQVIKRQNIEKQYMHALVRDQRFDIHWIEALFLGTPALIINGRSMSDKAWKTENAKKLFFYLLLHKNKKLSSDHLVDVFWHRASCSTGGSNLRKTIQYMRESLRRMTGKELDIIVSSKRSYSISPSVTIVLDLKEFERLIKQATSLSGDTEEQRVFLQKALSLYKEGFAQGWYDTWVEERRDFYQGLYEECLVMMADSYFCQDKYRQAIVWYEKLISINIYNEQYHCKLMQTYAKLGKFKDIVRDYEKLTKTLKKELGTKPRKETTDLYDRLVN